MQKKTSAIAAWCVSIAILAMLVAQPVSVNTQLLLGCAMLVTMIGLWITGRSSTSRHVLLAVGIVLVTRYVYWRTTSTLPPMSSLADFIPGIILFGAEMYCVLMLFISFFVIADPLQRPALTKRPDEDLPTVDVFVPSYNEDKELIAITLAAAKAMDYPKGKLKVYLLDDGATLQKRTQASQELAEFALDRRNTLIDLCKDLDVIYHARARNEHAKAGNLNAGLEISGGDLVVVFDADHAPAKEFLSRTVGHFLEDPKLFLVQTPHFFLNPDPIERNLSTFQRMPSENEQFYSVIQRGLDKWNASFFCGSAAVLRRQALSEVGGFSGESITEDCETALNLHASGWNSRYVDTPLIAGLQPETLSSFMGQRSRWCQGMMQILLLKNPLFQSGLSAAQRVCYLSSSLFWLFPLPRLVFTFAPLAYIFFSLEIYVANLQEFFAFTLVYLVTNSLLQNFLYSRVRWPWVSELYEYVQAIFLARSIFSVLLNPRKPQFKVTAKGQTITNDHLSELAWPFIAVFSVLFCGAIIVVYRLATETVVNDLLVVVGIWNLLNLILAGAALGVIAERRERRRSSRLQAPRAAVLDLGAVRFEVRVEDVSTTGAGVRLTAAEQAIAVSQAERGLLEIPLDGDVGRIPVTLKRTFHDAQGELHGFEFNCKTAAHFQVVAELMYADARVLESFRNSRRNPMGIFNGSRQLLRWAIFQPFRTLRLVVKHPLRSTPERSNRAGTNSAQLVSSVSIAAPETRVPLASGPEAA